MNIQNNMKIPEHVTSVNMLHVHVHVTSEHVNMLVYLNKNALL